MRRLSLNSTVQIELKHLRYANAAARHGSFRKAADTLGLKQGLLADLRSGTIDTAVVTGEPDTEVGRSMALWSERMLIALPETHPLVAKDVLTWADLKRERFVLSMRDPGPEIEAILIAKLVTPGEVLDITITMSTRRA